MSAINPHTGKFDARYAGPVVHDASFYAKCMLGGALACGLTHAGITPVDVTKCNMQVNPAKYKGLASGLRTLVAEEGSTGIWKGFGPTLVGYSLQGMFKYGLYEVFKDQYTNLAGEENAAKYRSAIWLAGSASAEVFADIALCPLEMTKVKIQTSQVGTFPTGFGAALSAMSANKLETRYPFGSLVPLWSRQIPYTMAKFFFFEKIVSLFYTNIFTAPRETYDKTTQLGVTFASGYAAGVVCAIVSHPADSLVSLQGKPANKGKSIGQIASETGAGALFTKGLGTRVLMIGTLTGFQWWIYDSFKSAMGMGTSGGK
jgi:solute carrier family 25 phosphate transporter 3